jgi:hypothetical protein
MLWRRWRLTVGWFKQWLIWEFWPPWFFYLPIIPWVFLLSLRYLGPLKVTSVNPGISAHGKFLLNTKSDKLSGFSPEYVAPFELLKYDNNLEGRIEKAMKFAEEHNFPVVLKPDLGGRGAGKLCSSANFMAFSIRPSKLLSYFNNSNGATYSGENPESLSDLVFSRNLPCADMPGFTEVTLSGPRYLSDSRKTQGIIGR